MSSHLEKQLRSQRDEPLPLAPDERIWREVRRELAPGRKRPLLVIWRRWWPVMLLLLPAIGLSLALWRGPEYPLGFFALPQARQTVAGVTTAEGEASISDLVQQAERPSRRTTAAVPGYVPPPVGQAAGQGAIGRSASARDGQTVPDRRRPEPSQAPVNPPAESPLAPPAAATALPSDTSRLSEGGPIPVAERNSAATSLLGERSLAASGRNGRTALLGTGPGGLLYLPPQWMPPEPRNPEPRGAFSLRVDAGLTGWKPQPRFQILREVTPPFASPPRTYLTPDGETLNFDNLPGETTRIREFQPAVRANIGYRLRNGIRVGGELTFAQLTNARPDVRGPEVGPDEAYLFFFAEERYLLGGVTLGYEKNWRRLSGYVGVTLGQVFYSSRNFGSRLVYPARNLDFSLSTFQRTSWINFYNYAALDLALAYRFSARWSAGPAWSYYSAIGSSEFGSLTLRVQHTFRNYGR